jgi:hypothetical protein
MKNKIIDLNNHLYETIEMLKNNNCPEASPNEKMDSETAKQIANVAKVIIDGTKLQLQAISVLSKSDNPNITAKALNQSGIIEVADDSIPSLKE